MANHSYTKNNLSSASWIAHPHVVAALAEPTTPLYGWDSRCTDGSILIIQVGEKSIEMLSTRSSLIMFSRTTFAFSESPVC